MERDERPAYSSGKRERERNATNRAQAGTLYKTREVDTSESVTATATANKSA